MWNERYSKPEFAYGTEPNTFLVANAALLRGPVLSLAEGEGRNAVYLAERGLDVLGVDLSDVGLAKARKLAASRNVVVRTQVADLSNYVPEPEHYGAVISISAHLPSRVRARLYPLVQASIKPGGVFLLEAYAKAQLTRNTGGPKDEDFLMDHDELKRQFYGWDILLAQTIEREVIEGTFHTGSAVVVQFIVQKRA